LTFKDQILETQNLTLGQPGLDRMQVSGKLYLADSQNPGFEAELVSRKTQVDKLLGLFGGMFDSALTGEMQYLKAHLKGRGADLKQLTQSLTGNLAFDIRGGRIHSGRLLNGVSELFGVPADPETVEERKRPGSSSYLAILGDFSVVNGQAHTDKYLFEDKGERLSLVGNFNLNTREIDAIAGVAPFRRVGRVLKEIPILGPIITGGGEGSLFTSYHAVKGTFSDPQTEAILFKSLSEKVVGTLEGVVMAPADIFKGVTETESPDQPVKEK